MSSETVLNTETYQSQRAVTPRNNPRGQNHWLPSALETLSQMTALPTNWNGYGSPPPGAKAAEHAIRFLKSVDGDNLPEPNIVPVSGGGIQLEWYHCGRELELEIVSGEDDLIFLKVYEDDRMEEGSYPLAYLGKIKGLIKWLLNG